MNVRHWCAAAILACGATAAIAQSEFRPTPSIKQYMPRLVAIMGAAQNQHLKLWFAGKAKNWELAAYELRQLTDTLAEAAILYPGIPVSNVTTMQEPLLSVADAVTAGNSQGFAASMQKLTEGCNACHVSMERKYVVMTLPTQQSWPANQLFAPPGKDRNK
jgi:hypothetical protein